MSKLQWAKESPKKPGWYWLREWEYPAQDPDKRFLRMHVVEVVKGAGSDKDRLIAIYSKFGHFGMISGQVDSPTSESYYREWAGPIEVPTGDKRKVIEYRDKHGNFPPD